MAKSLDFEGEPPAVIGRMPGGVGAFREPPLWLSPGDVVTVDISDVGQLRHDVVEEGSVSRVEMSTTPTALPARAWTPAYQARKPLRR